MLLSASVLLLTAAAPRVDTDIVPASLGTRPHIVELTKDPYDWSLQSGRSPSSVKLADSTANCSTATIQTTRNGKTDEVHDCGFD